jgi:hypothetical protein
MMGGRGEPMEGWVELGNMLSLVGKCFGVLLRC